MLPSEFLEQVSTFLTEDRWTQKASARNAVGSPTDHDTGAVRWDIYGAFLKTGGRSQFALSIMNQAWHALGRACNDSPITYNDTHTYKQMKTKLVEAVRMAKNEEEAAERGRKAREEAKNVR